MIIKSMSRREPSFSQLFDYMKNGASREDDKHIVIHNCFSRKQEKILEEFKELSSSLSHRKNGVYLYHEVISIKRTNKLSNKKQKQILEEIAQQYIRRRANENLVVGFMHDEKDNNLHYHLMISANKVGQKKRFSLRKREFEEIKQGLEEYVLSQYPELEQEILISRKKAYWAQKKDMIKKCQHVFLYSQSAREAKRLSKQLGIGFDKKALEPTVIDLSNAKKHRISTLGLLPLYNSMVERIYPSSVKFGTSKEWIFGDFREREQRIRKNKLQTVFEKQHKDRLEYEEGDFRSERVKRYGTAKEWIFGDFAERDYRAKQVESAKSYREWFDKTVEAADLYNPDVYTPEENQHYEQKRERILKAEEERLRDVKGSTINNRAYKELHEDVFNRLDEIDAGEKGEGEIQKTSSEMASDITDEYLFGNFTKREARAKLRKMSKSRKKTKSKSRKMR